MPKPLWQWLHYAALQWRMSGVAYRLKHGGVWHRFEGELPGWAQCGTRWLTASEVFPEGVGRGKRYNNPWRSHGGMDVPNLCIRCFAEEIPLLAILHNEQAARSEEGRRRVLLGEEQ